MPGCFSHVPIAATHDEINKDKKFSDDRIFTVAQQKTDIERSDKIRKEHSENLAISFVSKQMTEQGTLRERRFKRSSHLLLIDGILYRCEQIIFLNSVRYQIVNKTQSATGHAGGARIACKIVKKHVWSCMHQYIKEF